MPINVVFILCIEKFPNLTCYIKLRVHIINSQSTVLPLCSSLCHVIKLMNLQCTKWWRSLQDYITRGNKFKSVRNWLQNLVHLYERHTEFRSMYIVNWEISYLWKDKILKNIFKPMAIFQDVMKPWSI